MSNKLKDLLIFAAKACGYEICVNEPERDGCVFIRTFHADIGQHLTRSWAPHLDDGDGARMETAADLDIARNKHGVFSGPRNGGEVVFERYADHNGDRQAARRWASLRAAASIGRSMP